MTTQSAGQMAENRMVFMMDVKVIVSRPFARDICTVALQKCNIPKNGAVGGKRQPACAGKKP